MPPSRTRDVVLTYRYLRGAMIALLLMLLLSVGYQWWWETDHSCWLGSISAYYYTPARSVFVGSLCALGASLIAYKGHSPEEDVLLNFSGFMAFVVAMVPTVPDAGADRTPTPRPRRRSLPPCATTSGRSSSSPSVAASSPPGSSAAPSRATPPSGPPRGRSSSPSSAARSCSASSRSSFSCATGSSL